MKKVEANVHFPALEKEILEYWKEQGIFKKSLEQSAPKGDFVFYDGPPFATGLPHYGHLLQSIVKDVVPRYKTMQGYRVPRQWGWDCHGLPIENLVEKELGFKNKKEIEAYGIDKFNEACRSKVLEYTDDWKVYIERLGRFVDMEKPYFTMSKEYMESVWWVWKTLWDKELVYQSYRIMHVCPRCETTLAQAEVSEGYQDVKDLAVTVKFELAEEPGTYLLAWTTTPWTLPGNVALAVGKDIEYQILEVEATDVENSPIKKGEKIIIANDSSIEINTFGSPLGFEPHPHEGDNSWANVNFKGQGNILFKNIEIIKGSDLIGKSYIPPFTRYYNDKEFVELYKGTGWKVYQDQFVDSDSGTGIVHIAPAFGENDMALWAREGLPWIQHVQMDGAMIGVPGEIDKKNVSPRAKGNSKEVREIDLDIRKYLGDKIFSSEKYEHSYPHCWRCDTPLLNYATSSWFVAVEKIKSDLLKNAKNINWSPEHVKSGRFGKWLEGARDWSVSRQRFWASCIPLWVCTGCGKQEVFGSVSELETKVGVPVDDLHKHTLDALTWGCSGCSGTMKRVPDVLDTWFDSGSMPYAAQGYTGVGELKNFPADFIAEMVEQTRTWFYYQQVLGTALVNKPVFKNAVATGVILAEDGKKMSKKLKNYPDPIGIMDEYGADALRLYILTSPVVQAENLNFSEKDLQTIVRNTFRMLWNSYSFFTTYATIDNWTPKETITSPSNILDQWILAELQVLTQGVTEELEKYQLAAAARHILPFVDNLSNWYIRRSRKRFWKNENDTDKDEAYQTLYTVLVELSKLMAPFTPFIAEEIYRNLTGKESVHLAEWPKVNEGDYIIIDQMNTVREMVTLGLQKRSEKKVKVRQPLQQVSIKFDLHSEFQEIVCDELNVRRVVINQQQKEFLDFDWDITPELKLEGEAREIIRAIQEGRKKAGFNVEDRITLGYQGKEAVFEVHANEITGEVLAEGGIQVGEMNEAEYTNSVDIDGETFNFWLKRV